MRTETTFVAALFSQPNYSTEVIVRLKSLKFYGGLMLSVKQIIQRAQYLLACQKRKLYHAYNNSTKILYGVNPGSHDCVLFNDANLLWAVTVMLVIRNQNKVLLCRQDLEQG
jgi:hypothetical protein